MLVLSRWKVLAVSWTVVDGLCHLRRVDVGVVEVFPS